MNNMYFQKRERLVHQLKKEKRITKKEVEEAFISVPRDLFVPSTQTAYAYEDRPLGIGNHQTISAPHMVAIMVEALDIRCGQRILEIGAGSGYHAAITAFLVGPKGSVYSVERIQTLVDKARENLKKANIENVTVVHGDGSLGLLDHAPYNHIYVTCAAPKIPPSLIDQLKPDGSILIPIGDMICELQRITKKGKTIRTEHLGGCAFVPLIGKDGFSR